MKKCYICNLTKDESKIVKYANREICEECLKLVYETTPKLLNVCMMEDCFVEFA